MTETRLTEVKIDSLDQRFASLRLPRPEVVAALRRSVERELLIGTVRCAADMRSEIQSLVDIFEAKIIAVAEEALTVSLEGHPDKLDDFEDLLDSYGIVELQRTGRVALPKLDRGARLRALSTNPQHAGKAG